MAGPPGHPRRAWPGAVASGCDALLDLTVVLLATWTIVYHVALLLSLDVVSATLIELQVLVVTTLVWAWPRFRGGGAPARPGSSTAAGAPAATAEDTAVSTAGYDTSSSRGRSGRAWAVVTVAAAAVSATAMAVDAPWVLVWTSWLAAAVAGTWWAVRRAAVSDVLRVLGTRDGAVRRRAPDVVPEATPGTWETVFAVGAAVAAAVVSTITLRSNPDDLFYVNFSQWIAEHGSFPLRDTLFSDQVLPAVNWPPLASYDGLVGSIGYLAGVYAGTVVYVVVPPLACFLAVAALWRLLRAWRVPHVAVAMGGALFFLLFDGTSSYATPGNLFVTRLWQGKIILLCVLVPVLLVRALAHVDQTTASGRDVPPGRTTLRLFLGGVAAVGLSTTAIFLTPLIAVAGMAPLLRRAPRAALAGFVAMAGYPLAAGAVTLALGGRSADEFADRRLYRFDPAWFGHQIFLTGVVAAVAVLAVLVGALLVPHPAARVTTGLLVTMTGVTFVPGLTHLTYRLAGLGPTLWRVSWACTIGALVGVAAAWLLSRMRVRWALVGATAAAAVLALTAPPIWASDTNTVFQAPFHWQRGDATRRMTDRIIAVSRPGDLVLAPSGLAITLVVTDTDLRPVAPRTYAMDQLRGVASFRYDQRLVLVDFVNHVGHWRQTAVTTALRVLHVDTACVSHEDVLRAQGLVRAGYRPFATTPGYRCFRPRAAAEPPWSRLSSRLSSRLGLPHHASPSGQQRGGMLANQSAREGLHAHSGSRRGRLSRLAHGDVPVGPGPRRGGARQRRPEAVRPRAGLREPRPD